MKNEKEKWNERYHDGVDQFVGQVGQVAPDELRRGLDGAEAGESEDTAALAREEVLEKVGKLFTINLFFSVLCHIMEDRTEERKGSLENRNGIFLKDFK